MQLAGVTSLIQPDRRYP